MDGKFLFRKLNVHLDGRAKGSLQEVNGAQQQAPETDVPRLQTLLAGETQQTGDKGSGPLGTGGCPFDQAKRAGIWRLAFQYIERANNGRKKVVEVMGNPACQLAQGFHLLDLPQLFLRR